MSLKCHYYEVTAKRYDISHRTSTASSMTVMSVLHLAEGLMASSAGGMTKLLLNGSHIPSPKVYVNLQKTRREKTSKVTETRSSEWNVQQVKKQVSREIMSWHTKF